MFAVIADYAMLEIIKVSKEKTYSFYKTGLKTVFNKDKKPAEGYHLLSQLLSSSLTSLGFKPLVPPQTPIKFPSPNDSEIIYKVENLVPLRLGTNKRAYLWKASYLADKGSKKRKQDPKPCILKHSHGDIQVTTEIVTLQYLKHSSIPRLVASGHFPEIGNAIVMEPVGIPIEEFKNDPAEKILKLAKEVNEALRYAHEKLMVHCDVSPKNIVVADGKAILIDWGIAMDLGIYGITNWIGTSSFCSIPVLRLSVVKGSYVYQPRDDFESLFYSLLHLLSKKPLPWTKAKDIEALYNSKCTWMNQNWQHLLNSFELPKEIANELDSMHQRLFKDPQAPVDTLFL